jgi:uncharacterized protein (TIGR00251 family)
VKLSVKVIPSSSRDCVAGWLEDTVKIKVRAPAEKGRANKSVRMLIARKLGLPADHVTIISGETSNRKMIDVPSLSSAVVHALLQKSE